MRDSDTNNTKIDEKWDKNIFFTILDIKKDLSIYSVNSLCLIFGNVNGYFDDTNRNNI